MPVTISGQEKIIKHFIISTDPSVALLLQKKILEGSVGAYWSFFLKQTDYDKKFKVRGIINYAEQGSDKSGIDKLELVLVIVQISPLP